MFKKLVLSSFKKLGYRLEKVSLDRVSDIHSDEEFMKIYSICHPFTMTSIERMYALYNATNFVLDNNIQGEFVEAGVWKGGSSMIIASVLFKRGVKNRMLYMYDTYEGMNTPTDIDKDFSGNDAMLEFSKQQKGEDESYWCYSSLNEVKENLSKTGLDPNQIVFIKGKVEDTIPGTIPKNRIALLRLDTDWYESTNHEMEHLYPLLSSGGVLLIDDFGHWQGAKKAILEYFENNQISMLLNRIDYTGRIGIKP